jgi:hypothetical protein
MSVSSSVPSVSSSLPLSTIISLCIATTQTDDELDAYTDRIRNQSRLLKDNKNDEAFPAVRAVMSSRMPDCYKDLIASILIFRQTDTNNIVFLVKADAIPFYVWRSYDELRCCLKWTHGHDAAITICDDGKCRSKGDAMRTYPELLVDFLFALSNKGIDMAKETETAVRTGRHE